MTHHTFGRSVRSSILALAAAGVLSIGSGALGAEISWDGNGNPNNSGDWQTATNWGGDTLPTSADTAVLGDVTSGTRTVTVGSPQTIGKLNLTQTTPGAVNQLTLNDDLALSGNDTPFVYTPTDGSIITNISSGATLSATNNGNVSANFDGTLNMASDSTLRVQTTSANGGYMFNNSGTVNMNDALLSLDYAPTASNNNPGATVGRYFTNAGTWTLSNNSSIAFTSSIGKATSGFAIGAYNTNTGTMNVQTGSSIGFFELYNKGTLNLGSSGGGVSDATVQLGAPTDTFKTSVLVNGLSRTYFQGAYTADPGMINVDGDVTLGRPGDVAGTNIAGIYNGARFGDDGVTFNSSNNTYSYYSNAPVATSTGSVINVGDGSTPVTLQLLNRITTVYNGPGNTFNLNANATLDFDHSTSGNGYASNILNNAGTFTQAGLIQMRRNQGISTVTTEAGGVHAISGTDAGLIVRSGHSISNYVQVNGRLTGTSAEDTLTYTNVTGSSAFDFFALNVTGGEVSPGDGSGSVGILSLANFNVTFDGTSSLLIDLIGDSIDLLAIDGDLTLGESSQVVFNSSGSHTPGRYVFATYTGALDGVFGSFSGLADAALDYGTPGEIAVTVVPEPGALGVLAIGAMGLLARRRRARA